MFATIPASCNWQLNQTEESNTDAQSSAKTYAPAPGVRQPCEITVQLWQLEEQGGATSIRIKSSARTYELYAKIHSAASPSYVASFRGKEIEQPGIFFVKIPLQDSCSRASEAILRLLSIRDKTRLEVHQVALDVPGIKGGVLEAPDDAEHSVPEPITWNEGLSALSPKAQSQAAQIRGMLQSALQPGAPTNGKGVQPGFARGAPPAQLMQAIAKAALESQVMPSLPPVAARSMGSGTLVQPSATHLSLEPSLHRTGTASGQLPSQGSLPISGAGLASPDILPLLQSISSRLQRTDDRIAKIESTLDTRHQEAVRSAPAATARKAAPGPASADAPPAPDAEARAASVDGVEDKRPTPAISDSAGSGVMVSPFANGPGAQSRHQRRQSDPGGTAKDDLFPGFAIQPDNRQQSSSIGAKQPDFTMQFEQLRADLTADLAKMQADLVSKTQADFISKMQTDLMESMQRVVGDSLEAALQESNLMQQASDPGQQELRSIVDLAVSEIKADSSSRQQQISNLMETMQHVVGDSLRAALQESNAMQQASDPGQQELRSIVDEAVSEIKADSSSRQQQISNICTELCTSLEAAQADGEKEAEEISGSLAELRASIEAAQAELKTQHHQVQGTCSSLQGSLEDITADIAARQAEMSSACADLRRCFEQGQQHNDMQHDVVRKACAGIQTSSDDSHAVMQTQQEGLEAAAAGIRASVQEAQAEVKDMAAVVHGLDAKVSELRKASDQGSALASTMAGLRKEFESRLGELEDSCRENGTLLRQALLRSPSSSAPRSLQELSDQARGRPQEVPSPIGSPHNSQHSRSSSADSQGSVGESERSWQTATADLASQASTHSLSSQASTHGSSRSANQPPPPKPIRGRWSLPNV